LQWQLPGWARLARWPCRCIFAEHGRCNERITDGDTFFPWSQSPDLRYDPRQQTGRRQRIAMRGLNLRVSRRGDCGVD
jgi:hypothetical protein